MATPDRDLEEGILEYNSSCATLKQLVLLQLIISSNTTIPRKSPHRWMPFSGEGMAVNTAVV